MTLNQHQIARLRGRLAELYGDQADECLARLLTLVSYHPSPGPRHTADWDQRDVLLVCYGDQVQAPGRPHLQTLLDFLTAYDLPRSLRQLHLLPFFPSSSDDGFAVIDYRAVDPELGTWNDVSELGRHFGLMFDMIINHVSVSSLWFQNYVKGEPPYDRFFLEVDPGADLSRVVRPRSSPLLTSVPTDRGVRHVWMTFSADQVDLDYHNPDVLLEMIGVLLLYLVDAVGPGTLLITETNVPHAENVSYFGDGDEAHLVYQFSLPPLLLEAFVSEDATVLCDWLERLEPARPGTTYLNFTASHDGIGVRPLEGLLPVERIARLVDAVRQRGGLVSTRRLANGEDAPYELNTTYFDALRNPADADPQWHVRRFLASQAIMLALRGIPAVYFHSLIGTANDSGAVTATGRARSINRRKYAADELGRILANPNSVSAQVFNAYRDLLTKRIAQPAFHPDAEQQVRRFDDPALIGFLRTSLDRRHQILVMANVSVVSKTVCLDAGRDLPVLRDLLTGANMSVADGRIFLEPFQVVWLVW